MTETTTIQEEFKTAWTAYYLIGCPVCRATYSKRLLRCPGCGTLNPLYIQYMREADRVTETYDKWRWRERSQSKTEGG